MLNTPITINSTDMSADPTANPLPALAMRSTFAPNINPIIVKVTPATPKKNRGRFSEVTLINQPSTPNPCLQGFFDDVFSMSYLTVIGISTIFKLHFLSAKRFD